MKSRKTSKPFKEVALEAIDNPFHRAPLRFVDGHSKPGLDGHLLALNHTTFVRHGMFELEFGGM